MTAAVAIRRLDVDMPRLGFVARPDDRFALVQLDIRNSRLRYADPVAELADSGARRVAHGAQRVHQLERGSRDLPRPQGDHHQAAERPRHPLVDRPPRSGQHVVGFVEEQPVGSAGRHSQLLQTRQQTCQVTRAVLARQAEERDHGTLIGSSQDVHHLVRSRWLALATQVHSARHGFVVALGIDEAVLVASIREALQDAEGEG